MNLDFRGVNRVLVSEAGAEVTEIYCSSSGGGIYFHSGELELVTRSVPPTPPPHENVGELRDLWARIESRTPAFAWIASTRRRALHTRGLRPGARVAAVQSA